MEEDRPEDGPSSIPCGSWTKDRILWGPGRVGRTEWPRPRTQYGEGRGPTPPTRWSGGPLVLLYSGWVGIPSPTSVFLRLSSFVDPLPRPCSFFESLSVGRRGRVRTSDYTFPGTGRVEEGKNRASLSLSITDPTTQRLLIIQTQIHIHWVSDYTLR